MKKKRDAEYYEKRLAKDHPALLAEVRSLSVRAASAKARLIHLPTRLDALKREWKGASDAQRRDFVIWIKSGAYKWEGLPIADPEGRLRRDVSDLCATADRHRTSTHRRDRSAKLAARRS
jgi:hypothetical protein